MMSNFDIFHADACIICKKKEFTRDFPAVNVGGKGLQTLVSFCELRGEEELRTYLLHKIAENNGLPPVSVH